MILQAVNGTASAFFRPAASGLLQEAVPPADRQSANALMSPAQNTSSIAGPAIAAVLIALVGNAWALGLDALTFGISAMFLARVVVAAREIPVRTGIWREIAEGFRAVIERRWLGSADRLVRRSSSCSFSPRRASSAHWSRRSTTTERRPSACSRYRS